MAATSKLKHVAVIGAGIVGVSTAIWCQRQGHQVTLIDREGPAAGTSYGNAGILAAYSIVPVTVPGLMGKATKMVLDPNSPLFLRAAYVLKLLPWLGRYLRHCNMTDVRRIASALEPLLGDSLQQHRDLATGTPAAKFVHASDYLYLYPDRKAYIADSLSWDIRREFGFQWEEMDRAALEAFDPIYRQGTAGFAVNAADHGRVSDPGQYVQSLADHFVSAGGTLKLGTVDQLVAQEGRVSGVRVDGESYACDVAVVATGVWSEALTRQLGVKVPMEAEGGYHIEFVNPDTTPHCPAMLTTGKFVATPMEGRLRFAGLVEFGGLETTADRKPLDLIKRQAQEMFPGIHYESIDEWLGYRPAPIDSIPLIGQFDSLAGAYAGFGHQHVGLTAGAKTGRLLADLISGNDPGIDMLPYRTSRFG